MLPEIKKISSCISEIWETRKLLWKLNISGLKSVTNPQRSYMHMQKLEKGIVFDFEMLLSKYIALIQTFK